MVILGVGSRRATLWFPNIGEVSPERLVNMGVWSLGFTVADSNNDKAVTHFYVPDTLTPAQVSEGLGLLANLIDDLLDGALVGFTASLIPTTPTGIKLTPNANCDVEEGARFGWLTVNNNLASNRLATFLESKMTGEEVNQADAAVIAFKNAVVSGIAVTGGTMTFQDSRGEDITSLASARDQHKKER